MQPGTKLEKINVHLEKYRRLYLAGIIAGITCVIMRSTVAQGGTGVRPIAQGGMTNTASFFFKSPPTVNVITVLERRGSGHPGYPVLCLNDNLVHMSQKLAAEFYGFSEGLLTGHLQGKFPDVDGLKFIRVSLPASA